MDWEDLKVVLAVVETGSVAKAAQDLGVAHTTVLRRINAFETKTGTRLFERTKQGYRLNHDQRDVIAALQSAGEAVNSAAQKIQSLGPTGQTPLRITSTDTMCSHVLPQIVSAISANRPMEEIALLSSNMHVDLAHGHADISVRLAQKIPKELSGQQAGAMGFALYRGQDANDAMIGVIGPLGRSAAASWIKERGEPISGYADSFMTMREMAAAGAGRAILPAIIAEGDGRLQRLSGHRPEFAVPIWVAYDKTLGDAHRVHRLRRELMRELRAMAVELSGVLTEGA